MHQSPQTITPRIGVSGHPLTEEQELIVSRPPTRTQKWMAFAGCAKTTTAVEYTNVHPEEALYLAFNNSIAGDAKGRFPDHVDVFTAHAYARRRMNVEPHKDRLVNRIREEMLDPAADMLRPLFKMTEKAVRRAIVLSMNEWLKSDDPRLMMEHMKGFPYSVKGSALMMARNVAERIVAFEDSGLPFTHDVYLKAFALRGKIDAKYKYIIVDEAQDLNPVLIGIAKRADLPLIVIGDPHQCLAPGQMVRTPSGRVPIETVKAGDMVLAGHGSGKAKFARVMRTHTSIAQNGLVEVTLASGKVIVTTPEHTHFAGYEGNGHETGCCVYLMHRPDRGWRIGIANDYKDARVGKNSKKGFHCRASQEGADKAFVLTPMLEREKAAVMETVLSLRYGIPTVVFLNRGPYPESYVEQVFEQVDSDSGANRLMADMGIDPSAPHYRPKGMRAGRLNFSITLCAQGRLHRYAISGNDHAEAAELAKAGIPTRVAKHGGWRIESMNGDLGKIYAIYDRVKAVFPHVNLIEKAQLAAGHSVSFLPASNVQPGMTMFTYDETTDSIGRDAVVSVKRVGYDGPVYDIDVEGVHNFIAEDVATHNSIYGFRGAVDAMAEFSGPILPLSKSFRFGPEIATVANFMLKQSTNRPDTPLVGFEMKKSFVREYQGSFKGRATILSRTNLRLFESLVENTCTFHVVGGIDDMVQQVEAGYHLWKAERDGKPAPNTYNAIVKRHKTWTDLKESSELDEEPELVRLVNIVEQYGDRLPDILVDVLERHTPFEDEARIIVSTAHKAKGREWNHVIVLDDFVTPLVLRARLAKKRMKENDYNQEINLLYVTLTRAIETLSISPDLYQEIASGIGLTR